MRGTLHLKLLLIAAFAAPLLSHAADAAKAPRAQGLARVTFPAPPPK